MEGHSSSTKEIQAGPRAAAGGHVVTNEVRTSRSVDARRQALAGAAAGENKRFVITLVERLLQM